MKIIISVRRQKKIHIGLKAQITIKETQPNKINSNPGYTSSTDAAT